jgi:hypothetical protein
LVAADCSEVAESLVVLRAFRRDHADVLPLLAGIHTHSYKGTSADKRALASEASALGLPVWQSETGPLNWEPKDGKSWWHRHYDIADRMIDDLRDLRSEVWCDWQSVSVDDAWGVFRFKNFREDAPFSLHEYVKNRSFYLRKQVLNFIPPGFRILEAGPAHSIAALAPDEKRLVILVSNPLSDEALHRFDLTRFPASSSLSIIRTSGPDDGENAVDVAPTSVTLESGLLTYSAPQYSLTTLLIDFATRSSPVSETRPTL